MLRDSHLKIQVGNKVKVSTKVKEGDKVRTHQFEGTVIKIKGSGENRTFTVRRIGSGGIGIERIWPVKSPNIVSVKVVGSTKKTRRAKLYYLRDQVAKGAKLRTQINQSAS